MKWVRGYLEIIFLVFKHFAYCRDSETFWHFLWVQVALSTNTWISVLWILTITATIISTLVCEGVVFAKMNNGSAEEFNQWFPFLLIVPLIAVLSLLSTRMAFEFAIIVFRIETHLRAIREQNENK